jgi:hypothetical protein
MTSASYAPTADGCTLLTKGSLPLDVQVPFLFFI